MEGVANSAHQCVTEQLVFGSKVSLICLYQGRCTCKNLAKSQRVQTTFTALADQILDEHNEL